MIYYTDKGGHERDIGPGDPRPEVAYAASKRLLKLAGVKVSRSLLTMLSLLRLLSRRFAVNFGYP